MSRFLHELSNWSEVWALLIPLYFILRRWNIPTYLKPIRLYVLLVIPVNIFAIIIQEYKVSMGFHNGDFLWSNNFLYNIHSILRLVFFSWFFILLGQPFMQRVKLAIPLVFILLALVNFIFFEQFAGYMLSSRLLATEAALLLFYCLQYFIYLLIEERTTPLKKQAGFWIVTGLSIYVATNFFIFLFYNYLVVQNFTLFAYDIWDVHNASFVILNIFIARAFYKPNE
jgi:hypothetical protein